MFYVISCHQTYGESNTPMAEFLYMKGWTENPYIIKLFMELNQNNNIEYIINEFECDFTEFIHIVADDFAVCDTQSVYMYEFHIKQSKNLNQYYIITNAEEEELLTETSSVYDTIVNLGTSIYNLEKLSVYIKCDELKGFVTFLKVYMNDILKSYSEDKLEQILDLVAILSLEKYI